MLRPPPPETEAEAAEVVAADMEAAPVITPEVDEDAIEGSFSAIPSPWSTFRQFITQLISGAVDQL